MSEEIVPAAEHQLQFALEIEQFKIDRDTLPFRYTGERFKRDHPAQYQKAIDLLALGQFSHWEIGKIVHADYRTIYQVSLTTVTEQRERAKAISEKAFVGLMVMSDRTIELAERAQKPTEAAVPAGIMKDIYLAVSGLPTATIDVNHHFDFAGELNRLHEELKEKVKQVQGRTIEGDGRLEMGDGEAAA
jgi:hypothetical protein